MPFDSLKAREQPKENKIDFGSDVRKILDKLYDDNIKPKYAIALVIKALAPFFLIFIEKKYISSQDAYRVLENLMACMEIEDKEQSIAAVIKALRPILQISTKYPKEFEEMRSKIGNTQEGYIELNRLVTYEKNGKVISLHHSLAKTIGPNRKMYEDAMAKLAQIINDDPEVEVIEAVSYIVPKTPTLFTKYGFEIKELNEKDEEGRDIALAFILREEFLKRFLKNND